MNEIAKRQAPGHANPLKALPPELIETAARFTAFWSESLKGTTALVARLSWWIAEEGLSIPEAKEAMRRLMRPGEAAKLEYGGKAMSALAEAVELIITERHSREAKERQRQVEEEAAKACSPSELAKGKALVAQILNGTGKQ